MLASSENIGSFMEQAAIGEMVTGRTPFEAIRCPRPLQI
jgi:hypothetical protein